MKQLKRLKPKTRILYVEDTEVISDTISSLLELHGYEVTSAKNGQEGINKVYSWQPDIILMDLRMPVMNGYQAIELLKTDPQTGHLPIIVISAWTGKKERTQAKLAGADDFFAKPPDLNRLVDAIERLLKPRLK